MEKMKGPIIIFVIIAALIIVGYFGKDWWFDQQQKSTSDATGSTATLQWAGDGYLGYAFLQTVEMKKRLAYKGLALNFHDDGGNYAERLKKFADEEYDFIVLPVNSYLQHGLAYKYPGVIVAAISESKGADAIVGYENLMPSGKVNDLNGRDIAFYYTPESPSSFLMDLTISDFDMDELKNNKSWRNEVNGSTEVYKEAAKASKGEKKAFVMWEPEVSKAIEKLGMKKLWGSDKFAGYIIDVFVFRRDVVSKNPEYIGEFLKAYFGVINYYGSREQEDLIEEMSKITNLDEDIVQKMIPNIDWYDLQENCTQLFNLPMAVGSSSTDGMLNCIYACSDVLRRSGSISEDLKDPNLIINSNFLDSIKNEIKTVGSKSNADFKVSFSSLSDADWKKIHEVGTMRIDPITFQSGTSSLDYQGEETVDKVALLLINNYPNYRIAIRGHTGMGDPIENMKLSLERAEMVKQRLVAVHDIDPNRLHAEGFGATLPPVKKPKEDPRVYTLRWSRVEFILLQGNAL